MCKSNDRFYFFSSSLLCVRACVELPNISKCFATSYFSFLILSSFNWCIFVDVCMDHIPSCLRACSMCTCTCTCVCVCVLAFVCLNAFIYFTVQQFGVVYLMLELYKTDSLSWRWCKGQNTLQQWNFQFDHIQNEWNHVKFDSFKWLHLWHYHFNGFE